MDILLQITSLYTFTFLLLFLGIIDLNDSLVYQKLILFISVFVFNMLLIMLGNVKNKTKTEFNKFIIDSTITGLSAIVGYSLFLDLSESREYRFMNIFYISGMMSLVMAFGKLISNSFLI